MNWDVIYLVCFGSGLVLSVLSAVGGFGHLHLGHFHLGHSVGLHHGDGVSRFNAFTVLAFLCWFGGAGYLLHHYSAFIVPVVLLLAAGSGLVGASILFTTKRYRQATITTRTNRRIKIHRAEERQVVLTCSAGSPARTEDIDAATAS